MRTGHLDPVTGRWVDDAPPHEFPDSPADRVVELGPDELVRPPAPEGPVEMPGDRAPSIADKARAAKAFVLNKYAPAPDEAGPVTQESMDWAQRPDVQRANAGARLEGGTGTYEDRAAVGMPIPESQDSADARGFAQFAGLGAAGELAAPLVARGVSSVAGRARAMLAARRGGAGGTATDPGFLQPVEVGPSRTPDFWTPRDGDVGDQLFETPSTAERTVNIRVPSQPLNSRGGVSPLDEEEK